MIVNEKTSFYYFLYTLTSSRLLFCKMRPRHHNLPRPPPSTPDRTFAAFKIPAKLHVSALSLKGQIQKTKSALKNTKGDGSGRPLLYCFCGQREKPQAPILVCELLPGLMCAALGVGMAVGGLLHVEIVPCVDVCVVAPDLHAGEQVSGRLRRALQRTVIAL